MKKWIKGFMPFTREKKPQHPSVEVTPVAKKQQSWTEAQAEIINHLINMNSLIKISKHLNQLEYLTLYQIDQILCQETIDLPNARKCLIGGLQVLNQSRQSKYTTQQLPYQYYSVRSLLWKICVGYLEVGGKEKWVSKMEKNLMVYRQAVGLYIVGPIEKKLGLAVTVPEMGRTSSHREVKKSESPEEKTVKDHPLSFSQESKWGNYFKDVQLWNLIEKDTKRTRKNCKFFQQPNELCLQNPELLLKPSELTFSEPHEPNYSDSLTRIIFLYLKTHPTEHYSQGMNQFAALIYYSYTNKNSQYFRRVSQSDAYFTFELIMSRLPRKHFQRGEQYVKEFLTIMKKLDLRLFEQLEKNKGEQFIKMVTMKWFLSGFLTEFSIDESLLVWDLFISWPGGEEYCLTDCFMYMALSLVHLNRDRIMEGENIAGIFTKIGNSVTEIVQKTQNLHKLFPKLLQK